MLSLQFSGLHGNRTDLAVRSLPDLASRSTMLTSRSAAYDKLYADDSSPVTPNVRGKIYKNLGIDPKTGCIAVVRPDQTVSLVCALDEHKQIGDFFAQFMIAQA